VGTLSKGWITDWERPEPDWMPYYTRANAGETLPDPASPLGWTFVWEQGFVPGWVRGMEEMGIYRESEFPRERPAQLGMFSGYFYINLSHLRVMGLRLGAPVESLDHAFTGSRPDIPPYVPHPRDSDPEQEAKAAAVVGQIFARTSWPEIDKALADAKVRRALRPALETLSDADLVKHARSFQPELEQDWLWHVWATLSASLGPGLLAGLAAETVEPTLSLDLIAGLGDLESASPSNALWDLSRDVQTSPQLSALFDEGPAAVWTALQSERAGDLAAFGARFEAFLAEFGCRGPNEWDTYAISWEIDPTQPLGLIAALRHSPDAENPVDRLRTQSERREAAVRRMRELLADSPEKLGQFEAAMASASLNLPAREQTKLLCVLDVSEVRMTFRELGCRGVEAGLFADAGDLMMLLADELDDYVADPRSFAPVIAERLTTFRTLYDIDPPFVLTGDVPDLDAWPRRSGAATPGRASVAGTLLTGLGGSAGRYTGRSRVVTDLAGAHSIEPGDVLVAPFTDAAWTPLFLVAGAVVVDLGAINSHAMVVARELGIPCVVSVQDAAARIPDGALITVDGAAGTVTVESEDAAVGIESS
jgi:phosphohistidine swiveling domain-containing protein